MTYYSAFAIDGDWYKAISAERQAQIGEFVKDNLDKLPEHLKKAWLSPTILSKQWFREASEHIQIPFKEYWS